MGNTHSGYGILALVFEGAFLSDPKLNAWGAIVMHLWNGRQQRLQQIVQITVTRIQAQAFIRNWLQH
jgi:hypothetical protein